MGPSFVDRAITGMQKETFSASKTILGFVYGFHIHIQNTPKIGMKPKIYTQFFFFHFLNY